MPHLINLGTTWWLVSQPHSLVTSPVVTHGIGSRLGPRAYLDGAENLTSRRDSITESSSPKRVALPTEPSRPTTFECNREK